MRQRHRTSRTTNGVTTAAAATATAAAVDESQHIVHPVAVRSKIPLKRKVREKEKRAGRKAYASSAALAVFRKTRKHGRTNDPDRRRRSGVVNTKDKVRSWLERENPTRENVDSDNESHFPEEEIGPVQRKTSNVNLPSSAAVANKRSSSESLTESRPGLAGPAQDKPAKMMRSISENPQLRQVPQQQQNGRHQFSRSISHGHEHDFSRLTRKTESASHLLSKSEVDLEEKPVATVPVADDSRVVEAVTHPPVQKRIPNPVNVKNNSSSNNSKMPKSATDGHLKAPSRKSKFASFEFLNLITRNKAAAPPAAGPPRTRQDHRQSDDASAKIRKKIGLGPVKVVLKWHGAGRSSRVKRTKPEDNNKRKKRVIVYKNGDPTAGAKSGGFAGSEPMKKPLEMEVKEVKKEMVNITTNPLDKVAITESRPSAEAVFRSRRYSMQERLSQPPPLVRRVSEIQTCTTDQQPIPLNNNRRNRHSWTVGTVPELPLNRQEIGIDSDQEEDC